MQRLTLKSQTFPATAIVGSEGDAVNRLAVGALSAKDCLPMRLPILGNLDYALGRGGLHFFQARLNALGESVEGLRMRRLGAGQRYRRTGVPTLADLRRKGDGTEE